METINLAVNTFDASALDAAVFKGFTNAAQADDKSRVALDALLDTLQRAEMSPTDLLSPYDNNGRLIASNERKSTATVDSWAALQAATASGMKTLSAYIDADLFTSIPKQYATCSALIAIDKDKLEKRIADLSEVQKGVQDTTMKRDIETQLLGLHALKKARSPVNAIIGSKIRDVMDAFINRLFKSKQVALVVGGMDGKAAKEAAEAFRQDLYDSVGRKNRAKQKAGKATGETLTLDNASKAISAIIELARESENAWFDVPKFVRLLSDAQNLLAKH